MATKKTTVEETKETPQVEIVENEGTVAEGATVEGNVPCLEYPYGGGPYLPLELRNKLEAVAGKMLDQLISFSGEFNASQLKSIETAMEIYRTIRY